ncbi:MAG: sensor histidine kinase [Pseudomonadota bacterium]
MRGSLVARMTALVLAVGVLSFALHLLVMALWVQPLSRDMTAAIAARARLERELLLREAAPLRASLAARLSNERHRIEALPGGAGPSTDDTSLVASLILDRLRSEAGPGLDVHIGTSRDLSDIGLILFRFRIEGQSWQIAHRAMPPLLALLSTGVGWLLLVALGVVASLAVGVRFIGRPLAQVASRITSLGQTLRPLELPAGASAEVSTLVRAFNELVDKLRAADESKQQMLAGVSHDLRTPLARLRLRIETQCEPFVADELQADLHALERIVSQFLAYVQGDRLSDHGPPQPLAELVTQVVASYQAQDKPVRGAIAPVPWSVADLPVQRALSNLIDNAFSHGRAPVVVELSMCSREGREEVVLTVWDHGRGMTPAEFEQAQRPFVRLAHRSDRVGHCGLGLAIVNQMARQTGARLEVLQDAQCSRFGVSMRWHLR